MEEDDLLSRLGRLPSSDARDNLHPLRTLSALMAPRKRGRPWIGGPLLNQSNHPWCVGATGRELLTSPPVLRRKANPTMEECYRGAQSFDEWAGTPHDGSSARGLMKFFQSIGLVDSYYWTKTVDEAADFVRAHGSLALGVPWDRSMFDPDAQGLLHPNGQEVGGHEVLIDWYFERYRGLRRLFLCRNHWFERDGTPWGNIASYPGHFFLAADDLAGLIVRGGDLCAPHEVGG